MESLDPFFWQKTHCVLHRSLTQFEKITVKFQEQWFSNCSMNCNSWKELIKQFAGPHPQSFRFDGSELGLRMCIYDMFPSDADAVGEPLTWRIIPKVSRTSNHLIFGGFHGDKSVN